MYRLLLCLVLVTSTLATPRSAAAAVTDFYDTVDAVEYSKRDPNGLSNATLHVRGVLSGGSAPVTRAYVFINTASTTEGPELAMHCHRLAVLAMSKPGKFQFAIGPGPSTSATGCKLTLVTP